MRNLLLYVTWALIVTLVSIVLIVCTISIITIDLVDGSKDNEIL